MEKPITEKSALEILDTMKKINQLNNDVCNNYMAAIDFLEKKGLKAEFEEYLVSKKRIN